jgi:hypothetical protein
MTRDKTHIYGYAIQHCGEKMVGCIKSTTEDAARAQLRDSFNLPDDVEISICPENFDSTGLWEIYYGC